MERCSTKNCKNQARAAVRTTRPKRDDLRTTLFYDDRVAPKGAQKLCKDCTQKLLVGLCAVIDNDAEYKEEG